jgi:dienelactone hydrolase
MRTNVRAALGSFLIALAIIGCSVKQSKASETVSFKSGSLVLYGLVYKPPGTGPLPAVLYNHGSARGMASNAAFDALGPMFAAHGWLFFAPYRRGQGLSRSAGPYIEHQIAIARLLGGQTAAANTMVRLLDTDHLQDQMAAFRWLKSQAFIKTDQIAVMGNSFGGIESVLGAEKGVYCAAVDASGGAESWDRTPGLRDLMIGAVQHSQTPTLFLQAKNDYSLAPSTTLYAVAKTAQKASEIHIYPPYGGSAQDGHSFAYRGVDVWKDDVLAFLSRNCLR